MVWRLACALLCAALQLAGLPGSLAAAAADVAAPRAVRLDVRLPATGAPFTADALVAAVRLRLPVTASGAAILVRVTISAPDLVEVQADDLGRREVRVTGLAPAQAARLAALLIVDLAGSELPALPPAEPAGPAPPVAAAISRGERERLATPSIVSSRAPVAAGPAPHGRFFMLGALAGLGLGTTDAGAAFAPALEASWDLSRRVADRAFRPRLGVIVSAGIDRAAVALRGPGVDSTLTFTTLPVRLGGVARLGAAELRLGALVRPFLAGGLSDRSGIVWGGWAAAAYQIPLASALRPFAVAGVDLHPGTVAFEQAGQRLLALRALAPWLGVGIAWRPSRASGSVTGAAEGGT